MLAIRGKRYGENGKGGEVGAASAERCFGSVAMRSHGFGAWPCVRVSRGIYGGDENLVFSMGKLSVVKCWDCENDMSSADYYFFYRKDRFEIWIAQIGQFEKYIIECNFFYKLYININKKWPRKHQLISSEFQPSVEL